jgi:hypothetical protein
LQKQWSFADGSKARILNLRQVGNAMAKWAK